MECEDSYKEGDVDLHEKDETNRNKEHHKKHHHHKTSDATLEEDLALGGTQRQAHHHHRSHKHGKEQSEHHMDKAVANNLADTDGAAPRDVKNTLAPDHNE